MKYNIADNTDKQIVEIAKIGASDYDLVVGQNTRLSFVLFISQPADINLKVQLKMSGCEANIVILTVLKQGEVAIRSTQLHQSPDGQSNLLVKSVLDGESRFSFTGLIHLDKSAQKTDAYQRNDNLILSDSAKVVTKPILEILANDVKCTHGASTGRPNPEELWYLNSRGISTEKAKRLVTQGFLFSGLDNLADKTQKQSVARLIDKWI
jgi:Fe-S cluster assembly protein SufD